MSFFLNDKLLLTDKKKPFSATYAATGVAAGTSLLVTAKRCRGAPSLLS